MSVIVPLFNEADNVLPLVGEIQAAMKDAGLNYELVLVDDGSTDATWQRVGEAAAHDARVWGLRHARNAGQSSALWTGIQATASPIIATLDGDRQNDPADIPRMLGQLERYDFVCGVRVGRQDDFIRRVSSRLARWARKAALRADFADTGCAIRVFKRTSLAGLFGFNGLHRFLPVLVHGGGARTLEMPVHHRPRAAGVSKYGVWNRLGRGILDLAGVAWFQKRRLRPVPVTEARCRPDQPASALTPPRDHA